MEELATEDVAAIHSAGQSFEIALGAKEGIPAVPDRYQSVPASASILIRQESKQGLVLYLEPLDRK